MTRNNVRAILVSVLMVLSVVAVGATPAAAQADGEINVVLEPADGEVQPNEEIEYDVVIEGNTDSFSAYDGTISVDDPGIAEITAFEDQNAPTGVGGSTIAADGSNVTFERALTDSSVTDDRFTLATVTLTAGAAENSTTVSVTDATIGDYTNNELGSADLTVDRPEFHDVTGNGEPAQDLNGDGFPEDINGDGDFDIFDVQSLYQDVLN